MDMVWQLSKALMDMIHIYLGLIKCVWWFSYVDMVQGYYSWVWMVNIARGNVS